MENTMQRFSAKKGLSRAGFLLSVFLLLGGAGPVTAANEPTLVLNDPTEAPFTTTAGDGLLDIVVGEAFRRAGFHLKLIKVPAERALMNANAGIEDGDLSRIVGLEKKYPNLLRVPEKILDMRFVAFTRQAQLVEAHWAGLDPYTVGYIKGWKIFEQNLRSPISVSTANDPSQLFTMLATNHIDVALYESGMGRALVKQMQIHDVRIVEPPLAVREMFIYLHQRHADKIPAIAAALRAIKAEGIYTRVCREKLTPLAIPVSQCDLK